MAKRLPSFTRSTAAGRALGVALPLAAWLASAEVLDLGRLALFLLPLLLLALLWRAGVDPSPLLDRVARRLGGKARRSAGRAAAAPRAPADLRLPGLLVSLSLAGRAPPRALAPTVA